MKSINHPLYRALGEIIREKRAAALLLQEEVANRIEWPQNRISDVERGRRDVRVSELEEIAWAMEQDPIEIYVAARERVAHAIATQGHRIKRRLRKSKKTK